MRLVLILSLPSFCEANRENRDGFTETKLEQLFQFMDMDSDGNQELGNALVLKRAFVSLGGGRAFSQANQESPGQIIDRYIYSKPLVMFSKSYCPYCGQAKSVLANFRLSPADFEYIELDQRYDLPGELIQQEFIRRYGSRSVPKVFIGGRLIGGGDDTVRMYHRGELGFLLDQAVKKAHSG